MYGSYGGNAAFALTLSALISDYLGQLAVYDPATPAVPEGEDYVRWFLEESRRRSVIVGRDVLVTKGNETFSARALEIDDEGGLVVETPAGRQTLRSGEVSVHLSQDGETPADAAEGSTTPAGRSGAPNRR